MLLKFNISALLVALLFMLHNPIIINLPETVLELIIHSLLQLKLANALKARNGMAVDIFKESRQVYMNWDIYRQFSVSDTELPRI